jgi:hypothetical protein
MTNNTDRMAEAIRAALISPNESDSNGEAANVVDGLFAIARALDRVANAINDAGLDKLVPALDGVAGAVAVLQPPEGVT